MKRGPFPVALLLFVLPLCGLWHVPVRPLLYLWVLYRCLARQERQLPVVRQLPALLLWLYDASLPALLFPVQDGPCGLRNVLWLCLLSLFRQAPGECQLWLYGNNEPAVFHWGIHKRRHRIRYNQTDYIPVPYRILSLYCASTIAAEAMLPDRHQHRHCNGYRRVRCHRW